MSVMRIQNYIGGQFHPPDSDNWLDDYEPATGQVMAQVPDSNDADVDRAVQAAEMARIGWAAASVEDRADVMFRVAELIDAHREELVSLESMDNGKPEWLARSVDIPRCAKNLRHFAATVIAQSSQSHAMPDVINYTLRQPVGVVGVISPWNLPLYLFTWKIAPALASGNCVIGKPSEVTPATAFRFSQLCAEAGLPDGVLNVVHGSGAVTGNAIVQHPGVRAISFTGGTRTGQQVARTAAPAFKKLSLELGGKNPNVIFADCDYDAMLETTLRSSFANQGQICLCGSRILIEQTLYDRFRDDFVARARKLVVGDPQDPASNLGAVVSKPHFQKILGCIGQARRDGGAILCGGESVQVGGRCADGWFIQPTVIEGLPSQCPTNQQEIFGPVVTLQPFATDEQAIALANDTPYGLSATVWTQNINRANRVAERIEAGVVWVNCWLIRDLRTPFGGVKQSGVGREGGEEALRFFTQAKNVCIKY